MKRIKRRTAVVLLPALLIALGMGLFIARLWNDGGNWAAYTANRHIYKGGVLHSGEITDRNGKTLLKVTDGVYSYAEDEAVRRGSLHAVGDNSGNIAGTALSTRKKELSGWSFWTGTDSEGSRISLTLDAELQATAWNALRGRPGAVVVINYETGEIPCMVSSPAYDPAVGPDAGADGVFMNRCTSASFVPGSVFKLVTLTAARENIPDLTERTFVCPGAMTVGGDTVVCNDTHGVQTIERALANSCNVAFGQLAMELGGDTLRETAVRLGLTEALPLDGRTTLPGRFDLAPAGTSLEAWSGIGQYTDLVTPYAMARLCAGIAAGGTVREGTLRPGENTEKTVLMDADTAQFVADCMSNAFHTYYYDLFPGLDVCAKTGTAEIGNGADHAWFVGYLRTGAPLAFAVLVERGGSGRYQAGPIANTVLQKALEIYA